MTVRGDKITISGFTVDCASGKAATGVLVVIDGKKFQTIYGGDRPDIAKTLGSADYLKSQFYMKVPIATIGVGFQDMKCRVVSSDRCGYYESEFSAKLDV